MEESKEKQRQGQTTVQTVRNSVREVKNQSKQRLELRKKKRVISLKITTLDKCQVMQTMKYILLFPPFYRGEN